MQFSVNIIDFINRNSGVVTFTAVDSFIISESTKFGGFADEQKIYNIKGTTSLTGSFKIASVKIETKATSNRLRHFLNTPSLNSNSNITFLFKSVENEVVVNEDAKHRPGTYAKSYNFDIMYFNTSSVGTASNLTGELIYQDSEISAPINGTTDGVRTLTNITYGGAVLNKNGETREIKIFGSPGTVGLLTVVDDNNKSLLNESLGTYQTSKSLRGEQFSYAYDPRSSSSSYQKENSSSKLADVSVIDRTGSTIKALKFEIPANGVYTCVVDFPSVISRATAVNGSMASGGATKIIFDDLTDVKPGDRVVLNSNNDRTTGITVSNLNPDNDNVNECTLSSSLTAADNATVTFERSKTYTIFLYPSEGQTSLSTTTSMQNKIKDGCVINQYVDPVLTIKALGNGAYTITNFNGVSTSLSAGVGQDHEKKFIGEGARFSYGVNRFDPIQTFSFSYLLTASSAKNFSFASPISFFVTDKGAVLDASGKITDGSSWTNTGNNGGTRVNINNIANTATGQNTITISYDLHILQFGSRDVTMEIDFNKIFNYTS